MRCRGLLLWLGSHKNMVKSSEPDTRRSGLPPLASVYLHKNWQ